MDATKLEKTPTPIREEEAAGVVAQVADPIVKNLMKLCLAGVRMRFMQWENMTEDEWKRQLPMAPFDLEFMAHALRDALSQHGALERILRGETFESAAESYDLTKNASFR